MDILNGVVKLLSKPQGKIALGVAGIAAGGVVAHVAGKRMREKAQAYLAEPKITTVNGELYWEMPNGRLVPYFDRKKRKPSSYTCKPKRRYEVCDAYDACDTYNTEDNIVYIKGRPFREDRYGNFVPVKCIESNNYNRQKRNRYER